MIGQWLKTTDGKDISLNFKAGAEWQKKQSDGLLQKVIKIHSDKISKWGDAYERGYKQALKDLGHIKD